jgi:hypothetical protein
MLATLLIWLSVAVAVLALVDLFLSKDQKTWLSDVVLKMWSILDEAKGWSFADWVKKPEPKAWLGIILGVGVAVAWIYKYTVLDTFEGESAFSRFFMGSLLGACVGWVAVNAMNHILERLLQFSSAKHLAGKLVMALLGSGTVLFLLIVATSLLSDRFWESDLHTAIGVSLYVLKLGLGLLFAVICFLLLCSVVIFVSMAVAYIASATLCVGEFVVRRIAEYPKGPVLALSALCGGIVALIKAFG